MQIPERLQGLSESLAAARRAGRLLLQGGDLGFASAPSNIALVKYWGKVEGATQLPVNGSVSFTLGSFRSFTQVSVRGRFFPEGESPCGGRPPFSLKLDGGEVVPPPPRMQVWLERLFSGWADDISLGVESRNNFPTACGLASSASGYAALTGAIADLLQLRERFSSEDLQYWLCEWARLGSGSATRSAWQTAEPGFVAWEPSGEGTRTYPWESCREAAVQLRHGVVIVDGEKKEVSSSDGHRAAALSLLQPIRVAGIPAQLALLQRALEQKDWSAVAAVTEREAFALHAVMQSTGLRYFGGATAKFIGEFVAWRDAHAVAAFWTLDAGPNIHLLFPLRDERRVKAYVDAWLSRHAGARVLWDGGGGGIRLGKEESAP